MKDLNDVTTLDLFDLDAQLRDMFAVHRELFDSQDRERAYTSPRRANLFRSRMRFDCTTKDSGDINFPSLNKECE